MSGFALLAEGLSKTFTLHLQGGVRLPVLHEVSLAVRPGECVALTGPSGAGKSTLMRALYGNYLPGGGRILVRHRGALVDLATAGPRGILALRRETIGYVSQFLRVIPRVPARAIVAEPLRAAGMAEAEALAAAERLLARLNLPERLWSLPPATFSGGEQQRVNLARGFAYPYPVMLVDEPTASLDPANAAVAVALIEEAKARGAAIVGIFHDADVRRRVATREHEVVPLAAAA
ncbi:phosphonate C-P lyase system protein PhnL [Elioraea sp.]|uniref:phosphonate C-P lyase system protein PhnL n=1 Tax=Elioraea sp. TaxID=2185103 RepID=UPI00307D4E6A